MPAPKPGGVRWLARLDPATAADYAAGVARVAPHVEWALSPGVLANRVPHPGSLPLRLEPWRAARRRFLEEARQRADGRDCALMADVRECFPSITPETVGERLLDLGCGGTEAGRVLDVLRALRADGVHGLPIGPDPSAVLANAVLEEADRAVAEEGGDHLRWVDDFLVFVDSRSHALAVLRQLRRSLAGLGLDLAHAKTRVVEGWERVARAHIGVGMSGAPSRL